MITKELTFSLQKEQLEVYEWGKGMTIPVWLQAIKDEWEENRYDRESSERRCLDRIKQRMKEIYESEHNSVYCWRCDRVLPCEDHVEDSIICEY